MRRRRKELTVVGLKDDWAGWAFGLDAAILLPVGTEVGLFAQGVDLRVYDRKRRRFQPARVVGEVTFGRLVGPTPVIRHFVRDDPTAWAEPPVRMCGGVHWLLLFLSPCLSTGIQVAASEMEIVESARFWLRATPVWESVSAA